MKYRTGFVSNSSSSSFCIYGIEIPYEDVEDLITNIENKTENEIISLVKLKLEDFINEDDEAYEILEKVEKRFGLSYYIDEDGQTFIGRDFISIGDNETGKEFKESTEKILKALFGSDIEITSIEDSVYG